MKRLIVILLLASLSWSQSVLGSERNRNHTVGSERQFFTYPRRNYNFVRDFANKESGAVIYYADSIGSGKDAHRFAIAASPMVGLDYQGGEVLGDTIWPGIDGGLYLRGYADSLDFDLDARCSMFRPKMVTLVPTT